MRSKAEPIIAIPPRSIPIPIPAKSFIRIKSKDLECFVTKKALLLSAHIVADQAGLHLVLIDEEPPVADHRGSPGLRGIEEPRLGSNHGTARGEMKSNQRTVFPEAEKSVVDMDHVGMPQAHRDIASFPRNRRLKKSLVPEMGAGPDIECEHQAAVPAKTIEDAVVIDRGLKLATEVLRTPLHSGREIGVVSQHDPAHSIVLGDEDPVRPAGNGARRIDTGKVGGAPGKGIMNRPAFRIDAEKPAGGEVSLFLRQRPSTCPAR